TASAPPDTPPLSLHDALPICLDPLEHAPVHSLRIVRRLEQVRRDPAQDRRLAHPRRSELAEVSSHLAATHGEAGQGEITQVEGRSEEHTSELQSRSDLVCRLL